MLSSVDTPLNLLLVDDDINICKTLSLSLKSLSCEVTVAHSVDEALRRIEGERFDLILTDFKMTGKTGADLIREVGKTDPQMIIAVMTAFASIENAIEVTREGAFDYLPKPFTQIQLRELLKKVRMLIQLRRENEKLKAHQGAWDLFSGFTSIASQRLEEFIRKVAPTDATLLLTGESGTGKSELARFIHRKSGRASRPFITVNCTSLAESLLESEIFGHVKGAFTGAIQDKAGKFELANQGTLFLDEIGDLSLNSQSKLLRFLQERVFERVGSNRCVSVDTRVIAATNKDLIEAVAAGRFREDLYYRLNIFECQLVPLRHRKEDLPVLIQKFIRELSPKELQEDTGAREVLHPSVREVLLNYSWPGNIREVRNVVERLLLLSEGKQVQLADLPESVRRPRKTETQESENGTLRTLEEVEMAHIGRVLEAANNLENAAEILGITTVTLWKKRKQFGLR